MHSGSDLTSLLRHRHPGKKKDNYKNVGCYLATNGAIYVINEIFKNHSELNPCSTKMGPEIMHTTRASDVSREKLGK